MRIRVKLIGAAFFILSPLAVNAQSYETQFTRSLSDVFEDVQKQFGIRLKYNVDTAGLKLPMLTSAYGPIP